MRKYEWQQCTYAHLLWKIKKTLVRCWKMDKLNRCTKLYLNWKQHHHRWYPQKLPNLNNYSICQTNYIFCKVEKQNTKLFQFQEFIETRIYTFDIHGKYCKQYRKIWERMALISNWMVITLFYEQLAIFFFQEIPPRYSSVIEWRSH